MVGSMAAAGVRRPAAAGAAGGGSARTGCGSPPSERVASGEMGFSQRRSWPGGLGEREGERRETLKENLGESGWKRDGERGEDMKRGVRRLRGRKLGKRDAKRAGSEGAAAGFPEISRGCKCAGDRAKPAAAERAVEPETCSSKIRRKIRSKIRSKMSSNLLQPTGAGLLRNIFRSMRFLRLK